jgi:hypothetical protein
VTISRLTIAIVAIVIVAILSGGLALGLGVIGGKKIVTTTEIIAQTVVETQTQLQPVTQTLLSTISLPQTTSTITTTETSFSVSQTTLEIPTTVNVTKIESSTITETTTNNVTTTASGYVVLFAPGTKIVFSAGQREAVVTPQPLRPGFNGFYDITFQTTPSTPIHWMVEGNSVNKSSSSAPSGAVDLPLQAFVPYTITVFNDACSNVARGNAFNVTASIVYEY